MLPADPVLSQWLACQKTPGREGGREGRREGRGGEGAGEDMEMEFHNSKSCPESHMT